MIGARKGAVVPFGIHLLERQSELWNGARQ